MIDLKKKPWTEYAENLIYNEINLWIIGIEEEFQVKDITDICNKIIEESHI